LLLLPPQLSEIMSTLATLKVFSVPALPEGTEEELLPKPFVVVEISDKSHRKDSGVKLRMYAASGIQEYWIINLNEKRLEVYHKPENPIGKRSGWRYASVKHYRPGQRVKLLAFPKIFFGVSELIP